MTVGSSVTVSLAQRVSSMLVSSHSQLIISKIGGYHAGQTIMMANSGAKPSDLLREQAKDAANKVGTVYNLDCSNSLNYS